MRRCPACGGFFDGDQCPNQHEPGAELAPAIPPPEPGANLVEPHSTLVGKLAVYDWPNSGPVYCLVTSEADDDGNVGLMVLNEHVRVPLDAIEEI